MSARERDREKKVDVQPRRTKNKKKGKEKLRSNKGLANDKYVIRIIIIDKIKDISLADLQFDASRFFQIRNNFFFSITIIMVRKWIILTLVIYNDMQYCMFYFILLSIDKYDFK